jgi:PAS domain S-box-containing protein
VTSGELFADSECRTAVLDAAINAVVTADAEGRIVEYNPAAEDMFGWSHAEARGRRLDEMLVPPEAPTPNERFPPPVPLPDGESRRAPVELTLLHKNGTRIPVAATGARTTIDGDPILVSFFHDLSAERAAEKRFQTLVETLPLAVYRESIGDGFGTTYASPQVESIAGYPAERWTDDPYF